MKAQDLKKSILQYAMEGKLVVQDPTDEPASELLKRIKAEKERLIKEGKIKKEKPLPPITQDEIPYELPQGWEWVRLGDVGVSNIGLTYKPTDITQTNLGIPVLRSSNIQNNKIDLNDIVRVNTEIKNQNLFVEIGDILICARNGSKNLVGKSAIISNLKEPMTFGAFMAIFRSPINEWIKIYLDSPLFKKTLESVNTVTINQITQNNLKNAIIPIPPLPEQKRIVEKLEEILPLVEEYDRNEEILSEMNQKLPKQIRQSILQYAVQGKLVEQNPQDEPATELLKQIKAEKERLIKDGKIKKEKPLPPITKNEIPYELPQSWQWIRLGEISQIYRGLGPKYELNSNYKFINQKCIKWGSIEHEFWKTVSRESFERFNNDKLIKIYDLLINSTGEGTIGRCSIASQNIVGLGYDSHVLLIRPILCLNSYYQILLNSSIGQNQINEVKGAKTTKQTELGIEKTRSILIPLPPLAEQKRIVAKVDELMKYADKLVEIPSNIIKIRESKDNEINSKNNKVDITKAINKRAILNAKIIEKFNNNNIFSAISDEKLIFITEKVLELPLEGKYKKAAAGPLDKNARNEVKKIFKELNWFNVIEGDSGQKEQYIPLDKLYEYNDLYNKCFSNKSQEIDRVLNLFTGQNLSKAEPVATLYAVWNNLLIDNKECSDETIIKGFYVWSNRKARYNKNDLLDLLAWMRYHNLIPEGKGEKITV